MKQSPLAMGNRKDFTEELTIEPSLKGLGKIGMRK